MNRTYTKQQHALAAVGAMFDAVDEWNKVMADELGASFKLADLDHGNMTTIFAQWGGRYWTLTGLATLPHLLIMRRIATHSLAVAKA